MADTAEVISEFLEVTRILEKKGARAEKYWVQKPGAPCVLSKKRDKDMGSTDSVILSAIADEKLLPSGIKSAKVQERSPEQADKPLRRLQRYINRLVNHSE
jgi:hypothetical protein